MSIISYKILIKFLQKTAFFFVRNSYKKFDVLFRPKFQKSSNYQQQQPQLPFSMHKLSQDPSKRVQIVNFEQEEFTYNFTPKIIITYASYETSDKNCENSSANDDRNMSMVPNENTTRGLSNESNPNLLSAAVMEKTLKILALFNHRILFFPSPFQLISRLLRMEEIALVEAMISRRAVML